MDIFQNRNLAKRSRYGAYIDIPLEFTDCIVKNKTVVTGELAEYIETLEAMCFNYEAELRTIKDEYHALLNSKRDDEKINLDIEKIRKEERLKVVQEFKDAFSGLVIPRDMMLHLNYYAVEHVLNKISKGEIK